MIGTKDVAPVLGVQIMLCSSVVLAEAVDPVSIRIMLCQPLCQV